MLRVGVVQGDIALPGAEAYSREGEVTDNNVRASLELASSPELAQNPIDLAIWGEGSVDRDPLAFPAISHGARCADPDRLHEPERARPRQELAGAVGAWHRHGRGRPLLQARSRSLW